MTKKEALIQLAILLPALALMAVILWATSSGLVNYPPYAVVIVSETATADPTASPSPEPTPTPTVEPTPEPTPDPWKSIGTFRLTAYCPCESCSEGYGRSTATGATATAGRTIAVDPKVIPYGTIVRINGHEYRAEDCGGGVRGNHIDIFFDTHPEVAKFGSQRAEIFIKTN